MAIQDANPQQMELALLYDYDRIDPEHRQTVINAAMDIQQHGRRAVQSMILIGARLLEVKEILPHGQFGEWIETEFDLSRQTAWRYMNLFTQYGDECNTVLLSVLNPTVLMKLSEPSTPEAAREEIEQEAQASGKSPTVARTIEVIGRHKEPEYAPIWQLEQGVKAHLETMPTRNLQRQIDRLKTLRDMNVHADHWPDLVACLPQAWRKKDLLQALANVAEQLRQRAENDRREDGMVVHHKQFMGVLPRQPENESAPRATIDRIETAIHDYLHPWEIGSRIAEAVAILNARNHEHLHFAFWGAMPENADKSDVLQTLKNVLEQLRQQAREEKSEPPVEPETEIPPPPRNQTEARRARDLASLRNILRNCLVSLDQYEQMTGLYTHSGPLRRAVLPMIETLEKQIDALWDKTEPGPEVQVPRTAAVPKETA